MAKAILESKIETDNENNFRNRYGSSFGKPKFKKITEIPSELTYYIGPDSFGFFKTLKIDASFLSEPVDTWNNIDSYNKAKSVVENMLVVNDAAERGVKIAYDFIDTAKSEGRFQEILQVVENDRHRVGDQRKPSEKSKCWFLAL